MTAIPLAAVLGHPIGHSKSPKLHGFWLKKYNISGHYIPVDISPDDLGHCLSVMPKMGFMGANVTIPHKQAVMAHAATVTAVARRIGAANTLSFSNGAIHADNTDAYGFMENLRLSAPEWHAASGPAVVLGAGGASRAVLVALIDAGCPEIRLVNRTFSRAEAIAEAFGPPVMPLPWHQRAASLDGAHLIVNTTALGMVGHPPLDLPSESLSSNALVTDVVYAPLETPLLRLARSRGCRTVDGLGMLLHQAVPGFERWFGVRPEVTAELRAAVLAP